MSMQIQFCLVLHNHQPIGNFDEVFRQAYEQSYGPFLDVFEEYPSLKISLHTSGPLLMWLVENKPDYIRRLASLASTGNVEVLGGPMYEAILTMLPCRDRIGQIRAYSSYLQEVFQTPVRGMWMPERVWESPLTTDLVQSGMQYTVLDDFHFRSAGMRQDMLTGYYLTEYMGDVLKVFPGSEELRYLIPFADVDKTIQHIYQAAEHQDDALLIFADDGEKFGAWPETYHHVYEKGWLRDFFNALVANQPAIQTRTLGEVVDSQQARGKIYLPECSYREMTEWALPRETQQQYRSLTGLFASHPQWQQLQPWLRAGNWRNFLVKYSEANEMYSRMLDLSQRLMKARNHSSPSDAPHIQESLNQAEANLYRGQCNCAYWHGAFGGIYLPHLRNAVYSNLIAADNLLSKLDYATASWVEATCEDYNLDTFNEVRLSSDQFALYVAPHSGGMIYEFDLRSAQHNLTATMQRRPEPYHTQIAEQISQVATTDQPAESQSDRNSHSSQQPGCADWLQYDTYPRKCFLEHFYDNDVALSSLTANTAVERGDFVGSRFEARLRRATNKVQVQLSRDGNAWGLPLRLTKAITMQAGSSELAIAYLIEGLPQDRQLHLALEWNFAGLPAGVQDRFFYSKSSGRLGTLDTQLDLQETRQLGIVDQWRNLDINLEFNRPTQLWTFPLETVSHSEGGLERLHQSVCVMPHWLVSGDRNGKWSMQMSVAVSTGDSQNHGGYADRLRFPLMEKLSVL